MQTQAIDKGEVYKVRCITDKRKRDDGEFEYLTEWVGYDDVTWEVAATLRIGAKDTLNRFNTKYDSLNMTGPKSKRRKKK